MTTKPKAIFINGDGEKFTDFTNAGPADDGLDILMYRCKELRRRRACHLSDHWFDARVESTEGEWMIEIPLADRLVLSYVREIGSPKRTYMFSVMGDPHSYPPHGWEILTRAQFFKIKSNARTGAKIKKAFPRRERHITNGYSPTAPIELSETSLWGNDLFIAHLCSLMPFSIQNEISGIDDSCMVFYPTTESGITGPCIEDYINMLSGFINSDEDITLEMLAVFAQHFLFGRALKALGQLVQMNITNTTALCNSGIKPLFVDYQNYVFYVSEEDYVILKAGYL